MKRLLLSLMLAVAFTASAAEPQRYLLGTDVVAPQKAPTIVKDGERYIITMQVIDGTWVKHTLTPTTETRYGAFGEPVVFLTDIIPNP
jgi:hypothetical protein